MSAYTAISADNYRRPIAKLDMCQSDRLTQKARFSIIRADYDIVKYPYCRNEDAYAKANNPYDRYDRRPWYDEGSTNAWMVRNR